LTFARVARLDYENRTPKKDTKRLKGEFIRTFKKSPKKSPKKDKRTKAQKNEGVKQVTMALREE